MLNQVSLFIGNHSTRTAEMNLTAELVEGLPREVHFLVAPFPMVSARTAAAMCPSGSTASTTPAPTALPGMPQTTLVASS